MTSTVSHPIVAIGPEMPGWGSWEWVGVDLCEEAARCYTTTMFKGNAVPPCDLVVVVKHGLTKQLVEKLPKDTAVIYCPVDYYGSAAEIDADAGLLRRCARVIIHCERLRRYLELYTSVEYLDHSIKFAGPVRTQYRSSGFFLWVGVRSNLAPLVKWVNAHALQDDLCILTNPEDGSCVPSSRELGFQHGVRVRVEAWSGELQRQRTQEAWAAIDIKGSDFRSRHKPPAKALDFVASGVPLAMNLDSSPVDHLNELGFEVASPLDRDTWLSRTYWEETSRFGAAIREVLSKERIGRRFRRILADVLGQRR